MELLRVVGCLAAPAFWILVTLDRFGLALCRGCVEGGAGPAVQNWACAFGGAVGRAGSILFEAFVLLARSFTPLPCGTSRTFSIPNVLLCTTI